MHLEVSVKNNHEAVRVTVSKSNNEDRGSRGCEHGEKVRVESGKEGREGGNEVRASVRIITKWTIAFLHYGARVRAV